MRKTQHSGAWRRRSCFSFWESGRAPRIYLHYPGKQGAEGAPAGGLSTCRAGSWSGRAVRLCAFQQSSLSGSGDRPALQLGRLGGRGVITPAAQAVRRQDSQAPRGSRAALYLENSKPVWKSGMAREGLDQTPRPQLRALFLGQSWGRGNGSRGR